jgi:hypothetical protein
MICFKECSSPFSAFGERGVDSHHWIPSSLQASNRKVSDVVNDTAKVDFNRVTPAPELGSQLRFRYGNLDSVKMGGD